MIKTYKEFGYDFAFKADNYWPILPGRHTSPPMRMLYPGKDLGDDDLIQIDERELFSRNDYKKIISVGWNEFWNQQHEKITGNPISVFKKRQEKYFKLYMRDLQICRDKGIPTILGVSVDSVLMAFSVARTMIEFTKDIYEEPDLVEQAMNAVCDELIENAINVCKETGQKIPFIVLERGSGFYYRLEIFERFEWPYLKRYVDAFISEGLTPWFHFDSDWSINLPHLRQLPKGKCVCDLDSTTDIFNAKEILNGHMCISGDVPAALLALGEPEDVRNYCRRLIDEVGHDGGFMLTTGCECPIDAKPENVRAMIETGLSYKGKKTKESQKIILKKVVEKNGEKSPLGEIGQATVDLKHDEVIEKVNKAVQDGIDPLAILNDCRSGMDRVGELFSTGEYFLGELMLSGNIFKDVMEIVEPMLASSLSENKKGILVIATPQGDIHDLGKNLVATLYKASGFEVHDLGVDVPPEKIVEAVEKTNADILGLSALITPAFQNMKKTVDMLKDKKLRDGRYIIVGGGVVTATVKDFVGADLWTHDPKEGIENSLKFIENKK
jgi:methylmalonyl-CoA mutase cobalamin-binding domain/chain